MSQMHLKTLEIENVPKCSGGEYLWIPLISAVVTRTSPPPPPPPLYGPWK